MQTSVPDLEEIVSEKKARLKNAERSWPTRIGFADIAVYVPKFVKHGCEEFIRRIDRTMILNKPGFNAPDVVMEAVNTYVVEVQSIRAHPGAYLATDDIVSQKWRNLSDALFVVLARHVLEKEGLMSRALEARMSYVMAAFRFYNSSRLN